MNVCVFVLVWLCVWCLTLLRSSILKQVGPRITQALRGSHPLRLGLVGSRASLITPHHCSESFNMGIQRVGSLCCEGLLVGLNCSCWSKGGLSCAKKLG